ERHDISISELMTLNGLTNPVLRPGQKLMLPKGAKVIAGAGGQKSAASTSSPGLAALSDPAPEEESSTDNVVTAADEQPTYDSAETYTSKPGESLYRIAVMRGISLAELQRINNIDDPRKVRAGTVLKLPPARSTVVAVEDSSPVAPRPIAPQPSHER